MSPNSIGWDPSRGARALLAASALFGCQFSAAGAGALPEGRRTITLAAADGARLPIGHVTFSPARDGAGIAVVLDAPEFGEEFLSMRPFRCLPDKREMWCHLVYPYATMGKIMADDLADLEYALLFLFRQPARYGIDAWNGLYFKLALGDDGSIGGALHEADFNVLAVPPSDSRGRPVPHSALTPVAPDAHRFGRIDIRCSRPIQTVRLSDAHLSTPRVRSRSGPTLRAA